MPQTWTGDHETPPYGSPPWTPSSSPPQGPPVAPPAYPPTYQPPWPPAPPPVPGPPPPPKHSNWLLALVVGVVAALLMFTLFAGLRYWAAQTSDVSPTASAPTITSPSVGSSPGGSSSGKAPTSSTTTPSSRISPQGWTEVAAAVNPGVVDVDSLMPEGVGAGTGMVLSASGEILTNNHVIDGASRIVVTVSMTGERYTASVVGTDPSEDVAVLQLSDATGMTTIPLGDSDTVGVGDPIAAIGNAGGRGGEPDVAVGTVLGLHAKVTAGDQYGTDVETLDDMIHVRARVVPGDSGGPLVNNDAKVIGMNTAASEGRSRFQTSAGEAFAIPINRATSIAAKIKANPSAYPSTATQGARAYLGVQVVTATSGGAEVDAVESGSPAAQAGLHVGDVITSLGGTSISSADDLVSEMEKFAPNEDVVIVWQGVNGRRYQAKVMLASR